jgi:hypothetical protein
MGKLVMLQLEPQPNPASKRTEIAGVIQLSSRKPKSEQAYKLFGLEKIPLSARKNFIFREIDPAVLDRLDTQSWKCGDLEAIEARAFTENATYKTLRRFIKDLNTQQFFNYLLQAKIEEFTPAQVQAVLDEIDERS